DPPHRAHERLRRLQPSRRGASRLLPDLRRVRQRRGDGERRRRRLHLRFSEPPRLRRPRHDARGHRHLRGVPAALERAASSESEITGRCLQTARFPHRKWLKCPESVERWVPTAAAGEKLLRPSGEGMSMLKKVAVAALTALLLAAPAVAEPAIFT